MKNTNSIQHIFKKLTIIKHSIKHMPSYSLNKINHRSPLMQNLKGLHICNEESNSWLIKLDACKSPICLV